MISLFARRFCSKVEGRSMPHAGLCMSGLASVVNGWPHVVSGKWIDQFWLLIYGYLYHVCIVTAIHCSLLNYVDYEICLSIRVIVSLSFL